MGEGDRVANEASGFGDKMAKIKNSMELADPSNCIVLSSAVLEHFKRSRVVKNGKLEGNQGNRNCENGKTKARKPLIHVAIMNNV